MPSCSLPPCQALKSSILPKRRRYSHHCTVCKAAAGYILLMCNSKTPSSHTPKLPDGDTLYLPVCNTSCCELHAMAVGSCLPCVQILQLEGDACSAYILPYQNTVTSQNKFITSMIFLCEIRNINIINYSNYNPRQ